MKILLPLGAITFGASFCCCCGDMLTPIFQELGLPTDMLGTTETTTETTTTTTTTTPVATTPPATAAVSTSICGKFAEQKLGTPGGFTVVSCSETAGTSSIMMTGSTSPNAVCNPMRGWAQSADWVADQESSVPGIVSITMKKGRERLAITCSDTGGSTTITAVISPG